MEIKISKLLSINYVQDTATQDLDSIKNDSKNI